MRLPDVNVLVYAFRADTEPYRSIRDWLEKLIRGEEAYGIADAVLAGFLRIVTHPRVFEPPAPMRTALAFAEAVRNQPNAVSITPGPRHWRIFSGLCRAGGVKGNLVPDAWLAALAIESGSEWITTDRDYGRFPGLRWRHPLDQFPGSRPASSA